MIQKTKIEYDRTWDWEHFPGAPLRWKKRGMARLKGDPFEGTPFDLLDRVFAVMALRPDVVFQVLTKRPERMREYLTQPVDPDIGLSREEWIAWLMGDGSLNLPIPADLYENQTVRWPLPNLWLGTSVEDQRWADVRIPELLATPAAVRFLSCEPLLGPVDVREFRVSAEEAFNALTGLDYGINPDGTSWVASGGTSLDWLICGGESGPGARPCDVAWVRSVVSQCRAAGVACFVKQLGSRPIEIGELSKFDWPNGTSWRGDTAVLRARKGGDPAEWPEDLKVREMPR